MQVSPEGGINLCRAGVPGTITGGVGEVVVGETSIPPEDMDLKVACGMTGVVCQQVVCTVGGLHLAPRVHLTLLYNLTMLIARYGPNTTVAINTWATLRNSFNSDLSTTLSTDTWVSLVPRGWVAPSPPPKEAPFWVYTVGVVVGVAVMVIIILVLIKADSVSMKADSVSMKADNVSMKAESAAEESVDAKHTLGYT
nr:uncharacterized protein LOC128690165 [Cherax quadricarinatus]